MLVDFVRCSIDNEVKALLQKIDDVPLDFMIRDIAEGFAFCVKIALGGKTIGLEVCRIDISYLNERELVILRCIKGDYEGSDFFDILDAGEKELCRIYDCQVVRRHIDRAGMLPALEKYDYKVTEIVLKRRFKWEKDHRKVILLQAAARRTPISALPPVSKASL